MVPLTPGYKLQYKEGWTQKELENFVMAAIPVYCPKLSE
jgi:hypothetical protein